MDSSNTLQETPILYSYFRSSSSARVRIALNLKGIAYKQQAINLLKGEQRSESYLQRNPSGLVPCLLINGQTLTQSIAILEYLEETYRGSETPPLLPSSPQLRAQVRAIMGVICCDIQPLQNLRVLQTVAEDQRAEYAKRVIADGLAVVEKMLEQCAGRYCVGDQVSLADCCLIPQLINAHRYGVDLDRFPRIQAVEKHTGELGAFRQAHWSRQPDCPEELRDTLAAAN
ncbi:Glutathione S-transferase zeta-1 [Coemansia sp. Benny D115]|nr:Glutathione S-transferase zeta-1 [Coemansia sp. Benny D115]